VEKAGGGGGGGGKAAGGRSPAPVGPARPSLVAARRPIAHADASDPLARHPRSIALSPSSLPISLAQPWKAPPDVQRAAGCVVGAGGDYPSPIVDHGEASKECKDRMAAAYARAKAPGGAGAKRPAPSEGSRGAGERKRKG